MRVMVAPTDDDNRQTLAAGAEAELDLITLEPSTLEDLEEELTEIGSTPKAAAWIVDRVAV